MPDCSFIVQRDDLRNVRFVEDEAAGASLPDEAVRLRIDPFALTSNNITYGVYGERMHYWDFFPCGVDGFGCIPVWGFADAVESRIPGVAPGDRFYGYFPMSSHVLVHPVQVNDGGFVDGATHRQPLPAVYNRYLRCRSDRLYRPEDEAHIALLRPLFVTSFLIDDFLADNGFFGAGMVVLSSASSKTAYGTALRLAQRRGGPNAPYVAGLTSPANIDFARRLGCYDEVQSYDTLDALPAGVPAVYVDMSGSASVRSHVHAHWNERLMHSCAVGGTHWTDLGGAKGLAGPRPVFFFAPTQAKKRLEEWGAQRMGERIAAAWSAFMMRVTNPAEPWLTVVRGRGPAALEQVYRELLDGRMNPREGHVLSL